MACSRWLLHDWDAAAASAACFATHLDLIASIAWDKVGLTPGACWLAEGGAGFSSDPCGGNMFSTRTGAGSLGRVLLWILLSSFSACGAVGVISCVGFCSVGIGVLEKGRVADQGFCIDPRGTTAEVLVTGASCSSWLDTGCLDSCWGPSVLGFLARGCGRWTWGAPADELRDFKDAARIAPRVLLSSSQGP